jgi:hypothetical protein
MCNHSFDVGAVSYNKEKLLHANIWPAKQEESADTDRRNCQYLRLFHGVREGNINGFRGL